MNSTPATFPTAAAREALAKRFDLPFSPDMQDWEWEIADAERVREFIDAYKSGELCDAERVSLMEVLVQCVEDLCEQPGFWDAWQSIRELLLVNLELHRSTIEYWSCVGKHTAAEQFCISPFMLSLRGTS